jgi:hypothetical protein
MTKSTNDSEIVVKASYAVYEIIAKRLKPNADDEFVKECLEVVGVDINFNITEELAALCSMKGSITGVELYEQVMRV